MAPSASQAKTSSPNFGLIFLLVTRGDQNEAKGDPADTPCAEPGPCESFIGSADNVVFGVNIGTHTWSEIHHLKQFSPICRLKTIQLT